MTLANPPPSMEFSIMDFFLNPSLSISEKQNSTNVGHMVLGMPVLHITHTGTLTLVSINVSIYI